MEAETIQEECSYPFNRHLQIISCRRRGGGGGEGRTFGSPASDPPPPSPQTEVHTLAYLHIKLRVLILISNFVIMMNVYIMMIIHTVRKRNYKIVFSME